MNPGCKQNINYALVVGGLLGLALLGFTVKDTTLISAPYLMIVGIRLFLLFSILSVVFGMLSDMPERLGPLIVGMLGSLALMVAYRWLA